MAGRVEEVDVMDELFVGGVADERLDLRAVDRADARGRRARAVILVALEQMDLAYSAIVHADERAVAVDRPGNGMAGDAQVRFDVADELERIFASPVALVHEREDRRTASLTDLEQLACALFHTAAVVEEHDGA